MSTITKRDLVVRISNETGLTQQQVFDVVQKTLDAVTLDLAQGNTVVMRNFGTFEVRQTKAKVGRNPKDPGKDVPIPPRAVVKFKPGKEMEARVREMEVGSIPLETHPLSQEPLEAPETDFSSTAASNSPPASDLSGENRT